MTELEKHELFVTVQRLAIDGFICQKDDALIRCIRVITKYLACKYADVDTDFAYACVKMDAMAHDAELEVTTNEND